MSFYRFSLYKHIIILLIAFLAVTIFYPTETFAQIVPTGCNTTGPGGTLQCGASGIIQAQQLITRLINISVTVAFMALTVWLAWGAIKFFIVSGGDPKNLAHAWSSVTWAFMGIFFLILAWLVMKLIFAVTGANVTQYCLGFKPYCI